MVETMENDVKAIRKMMNQDAEFILTLLRGQETLLELYRVLNSKLDTMAAEMARKSKESEAVGA